MYIVRRGIENAIVLHRSFYRAFCLLDTIQAARPFSKTKIQKTGKGNERKGSGRRNNNHSKAFLHKLKNKHIQEVKNVS
jgi:hypothetical protein